MHLFRTIFLSVVISGSLLLATTSCRHPSDPNDPDDPVDPAVNFGRALQMNGISDYVTVPHDPNLTLSGGSFTVEAWVRSAGNINYKWIVAKATSNGSLDYLLGFDFDGQFRFITRSLANDITGGVPEPNRWYHIAGVQDVEQGKVFLYIDGKLKASTPLSGASNTNTSPLLLGVRTHTNFPGVLAEYLDGNMDEIRIWNKAIDPQDLNTRLVKPLKGDESGLVAYWNFDEASGTTVLDKSGHGHDGEFGSTGSPERVLSTVPVQ